MTLFLLIFGIVSILDYMDLVKEKRYKEIIISFSIFILIIFLTYEFYYGTKSSLTYKVIQYILQ